jgi:aconitate hydratase 2/2-methylisocitrate dehydratase
MSLYSEYLNEIVTRKKDLGLNPKPIDSAELLSEIIAQIKVPGHQHRADSLKFFIYNVLPGTTAAARVKAQFLKEIILGASIEGITSNYAFELLSHMKGGPSIDVLLDLALSDDAAVAKSATEVLKTQVFLYEADTDRLTAGLKAGNANAKIILESYAKAEFFTKLPEIAEKIDVVTYILAKVISLLTCYPLVTRHILVQIANFTARA